MGTPSVSPATIVSPSVPFIVRIWMGIGLFGVGDESYVLLSIGFILLLQYNLIHRMGEFKV